MINFRYFILIVFLFFTLPASAKQTLNASVEYTENQQEGYVDVSWANPKDPNWRENFLLINSYAARRPEFKPSKPITNRTVTAYFMYNPGVNFDIVEVYEVTYKDDNKSYIYNDVYGDLVAVKFTNSPYIYSYPYGKKGALSSCFKPDGTIICTYKTF